MGHFKEAVLEIKSDTAKKHRLYTLIGVDIIIFIAGLIYGYVLIPIGFHIRCPVNYFTGLSCPACGLTRICLSILHGNFNILHYNYALVLTGPLATIWGLSEAYNYIMESRRINTLPISIITITVLLIWMVVRNILGL